ncbi:hypothetical protein Mgra_00008562, partial [Meloidogyne graminicola]
MMLITIFLFQICKHEKWSGQRNKILKRFPRFIKCISVNFMQKLWFLLYIFFIFLLKFLGSVIDLICISLKQKTIVFPKTKEENISN